MKAEKKLTLQCVHCGSRCGNFSNKELEVRGIFFRGNVYGKFLG